MGKKDSEIVAQDKLMSLEAVKNSKEIVINNHKSAGLCNLNNR